ncbi:MULTISPECIES: K(+)-transporting ATPase subunit F [Pseudonocardia]|uniref:K+-transporting ATPase, KdpF subunit n=1 Tax=Pseudonocardia oroxyli TaxID=366584 RepID=A0A1G7XWM0_PSEOR|nr:MULTISPECIES: K(+)-transporting ATPase subunit F [Pseudonocardia]MCF7553586.1 K(+)-transporting ATPase subunit F [Pseudonocardia sp. WMMC193]SDG88463.1 K+-transporting ATPase, KdpF subunit [Pseudonocardia oroxyli]
MSTADLVANVVGGVVALALLVYLVVALLRPERF